MAVQMQLEGFEFKTRLCFGASILKNSHAKKPRPLSSKKAIHIVMSSKYAKGPRNLLLHDRWIENLARKLGRKKNVKIYKVSNNGSTLALLARFQKRKEFFSFLRALSGLIARKVLRAEKGTARLFDTIFKSQEGSAPHSKHIKGLIVKQGDRFWDQRPFTRIVSWGPDFNSMKNALGHADQLAIGFLPKRLVKALGSHLIYAKVVGQIQAALNTS